MWSVIAYLIGGKVTEVQCIIDRHGFDQCSVEEQAKFCHQAAPLVLLRIITEEAVEGGVKGVCDLHLWPQRIDNTATSTGLWVKDGIGQWADRAPGLSQGVVILHLKCQSEKKKVIFWIWWATNER